MNISEEKLGEAGIRRGSCQEDTLLFVFCTVPFTWLLRRIKSGYKSVIKGFKSKHLLFMDESKWFAKSKNKIDSPIFSEKIRMQLGIKKC